MRMATGWRPTPGIRALRRLSGALAVGQPSARGLPRESRLLGRHNQEESSTAPLTENELDASNEYGTAYRLLRLYR